MAKKVYSWDELFTSYKFFGKSDKAKKEQIDNIDKRVNEIIVYSFRKKGIMNKCILPSTRKKKSKNSVDQCIYIHKKNIRENAIAWRLNSFMFRKLCPICGELFNRGHINRCDLMNVYPFNFYISDKDRERFKKDKEDTENKLPKNYNILDSLLNHRRYYNFGKITGKLVKMSEEYKDNL